MFHRRYSNSRPLNSARYNRIICQTRHFLRGCRSYCTRWRKVTKVTNPISDFAFLSTAKSGKSRIKNPFLDSPKGTHPKGAFDWEIRISQSNAKSENGFHLPEIRPQGGFQLRNPNPDFLDFPFCRSIGKSEKGFAKLFS